VTELLSSSPDAVFARVAGCHREAGSRFIVGAGCEVPAATPEENVDAMVRYGRAVRPDSALDAEIASQGAQP
jgi:uroporphyrinogen-III decarboxylase